MRLVKRLGKLEAGLSALPMGEPAAVGIAWSAGHERVEAEDLARGEYIACDVAIDGYMCGDAETGFGSVPQIRVSERVTTDPHDLGFVVNGNGGRIGRVVETVTQLRELR